jgi:protein arginine kinase activator
MLCDECREHDASVHLTKLVRGEVAQEHLCAQCAAARGITTTVTTPKSVLGEFLHAVQQQEVTDASESTRCSFCNMTLKDFRTSGRLGCAQCYTAFEGRLRELLLRVHRHSQHQGRRYMPPASHILEQATTVGELRDRLQRAIFNEEFELAASLRDKLKDVE